MRAPLYFDREMETLGRAGLRSHQDRRLRKLLQQVLRSNRFYQRKLRSAGIRKPLPISHLSDLPFTTKAELAADHRDNPPFGTTRAEMKSRRFQSASRPRP